MGAVVQVVENADKLEQEVKQLNLTLDTALERPRGGTDEEFLAAQAEKASLSQPGLRGLAETTGRVGEVASQAGATASSSLELSERIGELQFGVAIVAKTGGLLHTDAKIRDLLTQEESRRFEQLSEKYPGWMPEIDAPATTLTPAEVKAARARVRGKGHHPHPLAFGGEPNPASGLVETGETRRDKNPVHNEITGFWSTVLQRIRGEAKSKQ